MYLVINECVTAAIQVAPLSINFMVQKDDDVEIGRTCSMYGRYTVSIQNTVWNCLDQSYY